MCSPGPKLQLKTLSPCRGHPSKSEQSTSNMRTSILRLEKILCTGFSQHSSAVQIGSYVYYAIACKVQHGHSSKICCI